MIRFALPLLALLLAGCSSIYTPGNSREYFETRLRGVEAMEGNPAAFDRLAVLHKRWASRGARDWRYKVCFWDRRNSDRAALIANDTLRLLDARDAVVSQRELTDVMVNALKDLEAEYDEISGMLVDAEAPIADVTLAAEQKYLARRMANNLALMAQSDMSGAVEAADVFGRDISRFQQLLDAAVNGNEDMGVEPPDSPEVEDSLAQVEDLFTGYVADSASDVLENVVSRYDAWLALRDLAGYGGETVMEVKSAAPAAADEEAAGDEAAEDAAAGDESEAAAAADEGVVEENAGDEGAGADETVDPADDGMTDDMVDDMADDEAAMDEEAVEEEEAPASTSKKPARR